MTPMEIQKINRLLELCEEVNLLILRMQMTVAQLEKEVKFRVKEDLTFAPSPTGGSE